RRNTKKKGAYPQHTFLVIEIGNFYDKSVKVKRKILSQPNVKRWRSCVEVIAYLLPAFFPRRAHVKIYGGKRNKAPVRALFQIISLECLLQTVLSLPLV